MIIRLLKNKSGTIKAILLILFILLYNFISDNIKLQFSNHQNYIPYYIWSYIWTLILGLIFSYDYLKNIFTSGKIKVNFIYIILSLSLLTMYLPNSPLSNYLLKGRIEVLLLIFWFSMIHIIEKK